MTVKRYYNLPNCTLTLEGLGEPAIGSVDYRPALTMLMTAECQFKGAPQILRGGRQFFENLAKAISNYSQQLLSGVPRPAAVDQKSLVHLERLAPNLHRITAYTEESETTQKPITFDVTTVQIFDFLEALDQLIADSLTLPDFSLPLNPLSKRYAIADEPLTQRALPAIVGVSSLAIAAATFFFAPVPETRRPTNPNPEPATTSNVIPNSTPASPPPQPVATATGSPKATPDVNALTTTAAPISDTKEIQQLREKLVTQLENDWQKGNIKLDQDLSYRVSVAKDGSILGYKGENDTSNQSVELTPLSKLLYKPAGSRTNEPLADFKVIFMKEGKLKVEPK